jgi:hypothetical protein
MADSASTATAEIRTFFMEVLLWATQASAESMRHVNESFQLGELQLGLRTCHLTERIVRCIDFVRQDSELANDFDRKCKGTTLSPRQAARNLYLAQPIALNRNALDRPLANASPVAR